MIEKLREKLGNLIKDIKVHNERRIYITVKKEDIKKAVDIVFNDMGTGGDYTVPIIETPSYSPDGKKIVFASDVAYRYVDIWIINSDGTGLKRLTKDIGDERNPTWSPDGSKIAYKAGNVWIMNPDGTGKKEVKNKNCTTQWFPGTNKLLCFENKIYLYDPITDEKQPTEFKIPLFAKITPSGEYEGVSIIGIV